MAPRTLRPKHTEEVRLKIQASQLINRLENHVLKDQEMTSSQVAAALGLLKKSVPDLSSVEHSGGVVLTHEQMLDELDNPAGN